MSSKLSVHLSGYPNQAFDQLEKMQPSVVKVFNQSSEMNIDEIRRRSPRTLIVYRQYSNLDYHGSADAFFAEIGDTLSKLRGRGILWEGMNEPVVNNADDARALNAWYIRFAQLMHAQGEWVAGFSWSTGNPTPDRLSMVASLVADAAAAVDAHAFHEYYSLWGGQNDWARYRAFEQALPANARKPVVITEAGLDNDGSRGGGFIGKLSNDAYLNVLAQYDQLLLQDPYVLGATIFQWGDGLWYSFDLSTIMNQLSDYVVAVGQGYQIPSPLPVPEFGPVRTFTATPSAITLGQSATLQWSVEDAQSVTLGGAPVALSDSMTVQPTETTTYTLHIVLRDGSAKDLTATVTVNPAPAPTFSFTVTPSSISVGQSAILQWDAQGVRAVYLDGEGVAGSATRTIAPTQTTTYTLHIVLLDGSAQDLTATITVVAPSGLQWDTRLDELGVKLTRSSEAHAWRLVSAQYQDPGQTDQNHHVLVKANRADGSPAAGLKFVVDWVGRSPSDAPAYVTLDGNGQGSCPLWASFDPSQKNGVYFTTTQGQAGDTVSGMGLPSGRSVSFVLTYSWDATNPAPPPAYSFTATPASIALGESATLSWSTQGAQAVTLDGQSVSLQGTQQVAPTQTTTYTLRIVLPDGSTRDLAATVAVAALPGLQWDTRLDELGVKLTRSSAAHAWRLVSAEYQDPGQSSQNHHVFVKALRADGSPAAGLTFVVDWSGRSPSDAPAYVTLDGSGQGSCPLWASFDPGQKNGLYFTTTRAEPGDTVAGMGLPNGRYVNFVLTFSFS